MKSLFLPVLIVLVSGPLACGPSAAVQDALHGPQPAVRAEPAGSAGETGRFLGLSGALTLSVETADGVIEVRLAEIDTPVPEAASAQLGLWLEGEEVSLIYSGLRRDRYDRALAQVRTNGLRDGRRDEQLSGDDGGAGPSDWLQYRLLEAGLARVMTHADNHAHATDLLAVEARARSQGVGLWGDPANRIRDSHPDALAQDVGSAQIVSGRVLDAVQLDSGRIYLNFGSDYRTDFTVRIDAEDAEAFSAAGLSPNTLEGRRVRVRGWLSDENGPMMTLDHPARLEVLDETSDPVIAR